MTAARFGAMRRGIDILTASGSEDTMADDQTATVITLPEPPSHRMVLVPEPRSERGAAASLEVGSWIELNDPQHLRLSKNPVYEDSELKEFLTANDGTYRYDYVRLGCTFRPRNGERFEKAWLKIVLRPEAPGPHDPPTSWSIFPLNDFDTVEETLSVKIGNTAKLLSLGVDTASKMQRKLYSLRGYREGQRDPFWELYSNEASSLDGIFRFHMVVRSAGASPTLGDVHLEAVISNRSFIVFREKRPFDQTPSAGFRLPAA